MANSNHDERQPQLGTCRWTTDIDDKDGYYSYPKHRQPHPQLNDCYYWQPLSPASAPEGGDDVMDPNHYACFHEMLTDAQLDELGIHQGLNVQVAITRLAHAYSDAVAPAPAQDAGSDDGPRGYCKAPHFGWHHKMDGCIEWEQTGGDWATAFGNAAASGRDVQGDRIQRAIEHFRDRATDADTDSNEKYWNNLADAVEAQAHELARLQSEGGIGEMLKERREANHRLRDSLIAQSRRITELEQEVQDLEAGCAHCGDLGYAVITGTGEEADCSCYVGQLRSQARRLEAATDIVRRLVEYDRDCASVTGLHEEAALLPKGEKLAADAAAFLAGDAPHDDNKE